MSLSLRRYLPVLVAVEVVVAFFAWRDLSSRDASEIRGSRLLWRLAFVANPGNAVVYWLVGRKKA